MTAQSSIFNQDAAWQKGDLHILYLVLCCPSVEKRRKQEPTPEPTDIRSVVSHMDSVIPIVRVTAVVVRACARVFGKAAMPVLFPMMQLPRRGCRMGRQI